jgi:poly(A) polymerase
MKERTKAIQEVQSLVENWHKIIGLQKQMDPEELENKKAKMLVFGSFKLGVHFSDTDIDAVCVFPLHVA